MKNLNNLMEKYEKNLSKKSINNKIKEKIKLFYTYYNLSSETAKEKINSFNMQNVEEDFDHDLFILARELKYFEENLNPENIKKEIKNHVQNMINQYSWAKAMEEKYPSQIYKGSNLF